MPELLTLLDGLPPTLLHVSLFAAGLVETVFPPFPGDAVTVVTSFALARHNGSLPVGLLLSWSGSYLGGLVLWMVGRHWSGHPGTLIERHVPMLRFARAQGLLSRRGVILVVVSRFIPGIRSLILIAAGVTRMPFRSVSWALAVAVALWQSIVVIGGYVAGRSWLHVVRTLGNAGLAGLVLGVIVIYYVWRRAGRIRYPGGADDSG